MLLVLVLSYSDMGTDILVTTQFKNSGNEKWFRMSLGFLIGAAVMHGLFALFASLRKPLRYIVVRVLASLCLLSPAIDGYVLWSGAEKEKTDIFDPSVMLAASRFIELIAESVPECMLQMHIIFCSVSTNITSLQRFSILSSLVAGAFTIADTNISQEMKQMMKQLRGPLSHPLYGLLSVEGSGIASMYITLIMFYTGYAGMGMMALSSLATLSWELTLILWIAEGLLYYSLVIRHNNGFKQGSQPVEFGGIYPLYFILCLWGMMSFYPWLQIRHPSVAGGKLFGGWICYRFVYNIVVFFISAQYMLELEEVKIDRSSLFLYFGSLIFLTLLGGGASYFQFNASRRQSLFSGPTGKGFHTHEFNGPRVYFEYKNLEEQRMGLILDIHPHFLDLDAIENWFLSLTEASPSFEMEYLPSSLGLGPTTGHGKFFDKLEVIYGRFGEEEQKARIRKKVDELRGALKRNLP